MISRRPFVRIGLTSFVLVGALVGVMFASGRAWAQQRREAAKEEFFAGKAAYEAQDFPKALKHFQRSYTLGEEPALLYNIAATLQSLERPGEAAATLREFVKLRPADPERPALEGRIENLERAQHILDRDREAALQQQVRADARPPVSPGVDLVSEAEVQRRLTTARQQEREKRRHTLGIALGVTFGALAVGGAVAAGILLTRSTPTKDYDFGKVTVTR